MCEKLEFNGSIIEGSQRYCWNTHGEGTLCHRALPNHQFPNCNSMVFSHYVPSKMTVNVKIEDGQKLLSVSDTGPWFTISTELEEGRIPTSSAIFNVSGVEYTPKGELLQLKGTTWRFL